MNLVALELSSELRGFYKFLPLTLLHLIKVLGFANHVMFLTKRTVIFTLFLS